MRARNLKPSFFKNDLLAELPYEGRLLFAGLWCLADRDGRLENRPKRIKGEIFAFDSVDIDKLLDLLELHGFIKRYETGGMRYIWIPAFLKHQHPHCYEKESVIPPHPLDSWVHPSATNTVFDVDTESKSTVLPDGTSMESTGIDTDERNPRSSASTVQTQYKHSVSPPLKGGQIRLNPESFNLNPECKDKSVSSIKRKSARSSQRKVISDDEWLENLKSDPTYAHVDFAYELGKMDQWLLLPKNAKRQKTRQFILTWINRLDRALSGSTPSQTSQW